MKTMWTRLLSNLTLPNLISKFIQIVSVFRMRPVAFDTAISESRQYPVFFPIHECETSVLTNLIFYVLLCFLTYHVPEYLIRCVDSGPPLDLHPDCQHIRKSIYTIKILYTIPNQLILFTDERR